MRYTTYICIYIYVCMFACFLFGTRKTGFSPALTRQGGLIFIARSRLEHRPRPRQWRVCFPNLFGFLWAQEFYSLSASKLLGMVQNEGSSDQAPSFGDLKSCLIDNMIMSFLVLRCSILKHSPGLGSNDLSQFPRQFTHEQR